MKFTTPVIASILCLSLSSCAAVAHVASDVVDCTVAEIQPAINTYGPAFDAIVKEATGQGGSVNWSQVLAGTKALVTDEGMCVVADLFTQYLSAEPAATMTPESMSYLAAPTAVVSEVKQEGWVAGDLHAGFNQIRHMRGFDKKTYKTRYGTI